MKRRNFTLVELLMVIGIIVLLAGLMIPAVTSSRTRGMVTQAKADMSSIKLALLAVERDYKTILKVDSSFSVTGGDCAQTATGYDSNKVYVVRYDGSNDTEKGKYNALIKELSVPRDVGNKNFNVRNVKYLDPRPDYSEADASTLWRDPWDNPYVILINTNAAEKVYLPYTATKLLSTPSNHDGNNLVLRGKVFLYSFGPNGEENESFNADNGGKSTADDIRGWEK